MNIQTPGLRAAEPRQSSDQRSITLQFHDNALLPLLHGEHDRHLARIEQVLGVRVASRGNRIAISGVAARTEMAEAALLALWKRLERGEHVGTAEVEAALRLAEGGAALGEPRLPLQDLPAIRTRKGAIAPRSAAQAAYIDMLSRHDMVFGIGPAGTGKTYLAVACAVFATPIPPFAAYFLKTGAGMSTAAIMVLEVGRYSGVMVAAWLVRRRIDETGAKPFFLLALGIYAVVSLYWWFFLRDGFGGSVGVWLSYFLIGLGAATWAMANRARSSAAPRTSRPATACRSRCRAR